MHRRREFVPQFTLRPIYYAVAHSFMQYSVKSRGNANETCLAFSKNLLNNLIKGIGKKGKLKKDLDYKTTDLLRNGTKRE